GGRTTPENMNPACGHDNRLKNRGWQLIKAGPRTFVWISPLGRRHTSHLDPIAPPLPAPIPRPTAPEPAELDDHGQPRPTFEPLTQHGKPIDTTPSDHAPPVPDASDPDPPPFRREVCLA